MDSTNKIGEGRAEKLTQKAFPGLSRTQLEEAIQAGLIIRRDHRPLKKGTRVDVSELDFGPLKTELDRLRRGNPTLHVEVVHEEAGFWVVDKPAGLPGHPLRLEDFETLTHWALAKDPAIAHAFQEPQPTLTPHRLDTGTSGLNIVCRTRASFETWRQRFTNREVKKTYYAWCWGVPEAEQWVCEAAIGIAKGKPGRMCVNGKDPRFAVSRIKVLKTLEERFLAQVDCETGVTHQVRVHLSNAGYPLLGDRKYDKDFESRPLQPGHHQLRATRLRWNDVVFNASVQDFSEF